MTREGFRRHLREVQDDVLVLSSMVEKAIARAMEALKRRDREASQRIVAEDDLIDRKRFEIEEKCLHLMATQQPMASDLRELVAIMYITVDLERMGDHAEGMAKLNIMIGDEPLMKPLIDIPRMADIAVDMTRRAVAAFINRDAEEARSVIKVDDEVDALWEQVYRELLTYMIEDPKKITQGTYLIWVAHNLERIADRATNICERAIFLVTGHMVEAGGSKHW